MTKSIVLERTFILATRDTGYKSTAAAVAELVDNALQGRARHVAVAVRKDTDDQDLTLAVVDDGVGMNGWTLRTALSFGGSTRFNDRGGQGRFGMGLPNSSVSQARRLDLYSWQRGKTPVYCYLDVDQIAAGQMTEVPTTCRRPLPDWLIPHAHHRGTCVVWRRCDRLDCRRASTLVGRLRETLGQWFRYFIWDGVRLTVNGEPVEPIDPLFLERPDIPVPGRPYGDPLEFELRLPHQPRRTAVVTVRFVELPLEQLHSLSAEEKRSLGIVKGAGVSVIRAGREIDYGWYLMGDKRKENYDDWWRCEVRFDPELDEYFGVTHSKQGITPSAQLRACVSRDLEGIAHKLNARVRRRYAKIKAQLLEGQTAATRTASRVDKDLPPVRRPRVVAGQNGGGQVQAGGLTYRLRTEKSGGPDFYNWRYDGDGLVEVTVNAAHPFYRRLYEPLCENRNDSISSALECLLLSAARAEVALARKRGYGPKLADCRRAWSDALAVFLGL